MLSYRDQASGIMAEDETGGGHFVGVVLRPHVTIRPGHDRDVAMRLHREAHAKCFIANSVNFPVEHEPLVQWEGEMVAVAD